MEFTPGQVQHLLNLSPEVFRHWKKVLPPLVGRNGYRPCFSLGDLLALAVIKEAATGAGLRVGLLEGLANDLFELTRLNTWTTLERSLICLEPSKGVVSLLPDTHAPQFDVACLLLRGKPLVAGLRNRLLKDNEDQQDCLSFPPLVVGSPPRREGAA